jgi:hypothetical protein
MQDTFYSQDLPLGNAVKAFVEAILEDSDYDVFPYGYESTLAPLKKRLRKLKQNLPTANFGEWDKASEIKRVVYKVTNSPDFVVFNKHDESDEEEFKLVEVKSCRQQMKDGLFVIKNLDVYQAFWPDAYLIYAFSSESLKRLSPNAGLWDQLRCVRVKELSPPTKKKDAVAFSALKPLHDVFLKIDPKKDYKRFKKTLDGILASH